EATRAIPQLSLRQFGHAGDMGLLGSLLGLVLLLFLLLLIARALLDWVGVLSSRSSTSSGEGVLKAREVTYRLTEPVIAPVRRVLKPVNLGGVQFDLAFTVVFIATLILRSVVTSLWAAPGSTDRPTPRSAARSAVDPTAQAHLLGDSREVPHTGPFDIGDMP